MDYQYIRVDTASIQRVLDEFSRAGWRVHTFRRLPTASTTDLLFDILFERES